MLPTRFLLGAALAGFVALWPRPAAAQATLRGRVIDSELGTPVPDATVRVQGRAAALTTDSLGVFEAPGLPAGPIEIHIQVIGYAPEDFVLNLPATGVVAGDFIMNFTGVNLPEVVVEARAEQLMPRYTDFERRRERDLGAFLRWDELKERGFSSVGDALRTVRGVRIRCVQEAFECYAVMVRTPNCQPTWFIDGVEVHSFHENTPIRDVYGIEVYRGAGEIPAEFAGSNAACGVIAIWTKSRPYH